MSTIMQPSSNLGGPALLTTAGTTATIFQAANLTVAATPVAQAYILSVPGGGTFPGGNLAGTQGPGILDMDEFEVVAAGSVFQNGTSGNVTVGLYAGTSLTPGSNTLLFASTARAVTAGTRAPWCLRVGFAFDNASGIMEGWVYRMQINNLGDTPANITNTLTGLKTGVDPVTNFCIGVTFSVGAATNACTLGTFKLVQDQ